MSITLARPANRELAWLAVAAAASIAAAATAYVGLTASHDITVNGSAIYTTYTPDGAGCLTGGPLPGSQVVIANDAGKTLALPAITSSLDSGVCTLSFTAKVPSSSFYTVTIPGRAPLHESRADMRHLDFAI